MIHLVGCVTEMVLCTNIVPVFLLSIIYHILSRVTLSLEFQSMDAAGIRNIDNASSIKNNDVDPFKRQNSGCSWNLSCVVDSACLKREVQISSGGFARPQPLGRRSR